MSAPSIPHTCDPPGYHGAYPSPCRACGTMRGGFCDAAPRASLRAPWQAADHGFHTWAAAKRILAAHFRQQGSDIASLAAATATPPEMLRRLIKGQQKYTLESFTRIAGALGLNPGVVYLQSLAEAAEITANPTTL